MQDKYGTANFETCSSTSASGTRLRIVLNSCYHMNKTYQLFNTTVFSLHTGNCLKSQILQISYFLARTPNINLKRRLFSVSAKPEHFLPQSETLTLFCMEQACKRTHTEPFWLRFPSCYHKSKNITRKRAISSSLNDIHN